MKQQIVTITSQGQITIPAFIRREFGLNKYPKATVKAEGGKIVVEPIPNLTSLAGILKNKALKEKNITDIIKLEKEAVVKAIVKKYSPFKK